MATEINYSLLRYQADNIPNFDGNPKLLQRFIIASENLLKAFQNTTNPNSPINICLLDTIFSKLKGRAADLICPRSELNSWQSIKEVLIASFSDQRGIDCLFQDLTSLKLKPNETLLEFGNRIQDVRSLLISKLNNMNEDRQIKLMKISHYEEMALKTYINNLPYQIQLAIRLKVPDSLEQALSYTVEELNFLEFKNKNNQTKINPPLQNKPQNNPTKTNFRPMYVHNVPRPQVNIHNVPRPQQRFMSHPSHYYPSFNQNSNFQNRQPNIFQYNNTHNPNFNKPPTNVFKPQSQVTKFLPKPTPMDTTSSNIRTTKPFSTRLHNQFVHESPDSTTQDPIPGTSSNNSQINNQYSDCFDYNSEECYQYPDTSFGYDDDTIFHPCNQQYDNEQHYDETMPTDFSQVNFPPAQDTKPET